MLHTGKMAKDQLRIDNCINPDADPYENLANAIIVQAVKDYANGYKREECLRFFKSSWYSTLTNLPSEFIIKSARKLAGEE